MKKLNPIAVQVGKSRLASESITEWVKRPVKLTHGGKRQGSGRKPRPRKVAITVRMTEEQRHSVSRSAKACGVSLEAWARARLGI